MLISSMLKLSHSEEGCRKMSLTVVTLSGSVNIWKPKYREEKTSVRSDTNLGEFKAFHAAIKETKEDKLRTKIRI